MRAFVILATALLLSGNAISQELPGVELEACKATGLLALRERSPAVKDLVFDLDSFVVAKANAKVEDTSIRFVIMGEVYIERKETGKAQQFLCLIGEKGKVLLTFFTAR